MLKFLSMHVRQFTDNKNMYSMTSLHTESALVERQSWGWDEKELEGNEVSLGKVSSFHFSSPSVIPITSLISVIYDAYHYGIEFPPLICARINRNVPKEFPERRVENCLRFTFFQLDWGARAALLKCHVVNLKKNSIQNQF